VNALTKPELYSHHWDRKTLDDLMDRGVLLPTKLHIQITSRCSHRCITCNHYLNEDQTDALDTPTLHRVLEEARDLGMSNLSITGGEPLLREDLHAITAKARHLGFEVITVATNGDHLAKRDRAEALVAAGATHVPMSLQGWNTHDAIVGAKGSRDRVVRAVEHLLDLTDGDSDRVSVGMVAMKQTLGELDEVARFAREAGCGLRVNVLDNKLFFFKGASTSTDEQWPDDREATDRFVARCFELSAEGLLKLWPRNIIFLERYLRGEALTSPCPVGLEALYISHKGHVYPGCWEKDTGLSVLTSSLGEIVSTETYRELRHDAYSRRCGGCGCTFRTMSAHYVPYIVEGWVRTGRLER